MVKIKKILNAVMSVCLGYYAGHCIFVLWNHHTHPEYYAMQSAPWYISILVNGVIVLVVVLICVMIKVLLNTIEKKKKP